MRTKKSFINIITSCSSYLILMVGSFLTRGILLRLLGDNFGGIETTFLNVVSMLAIVELGLGTGIVYKLYEPIVNNDNKRIAILLNFLRRSYSIIILIVAGAGIISSFFVPMLVNEDEGFSYSYLLFVFLFYLFDVVCSYLYAHKRAMFVADQRNYINVICHTVAQIFMYIVQITGLFFLNKHYGYEVAFIGYLALKVICRVAENVFISIFFNKRYGHIDLKCKETMPKKERVALFGNIRALLMHSIAGFTLRSIPSMFITKFIDLASSAIYGNYTLIFSGLTTLSNHFFNGITASFGNLLTTSSKEDTVSKFNIIYFLNFLIYSFFTVSFFNISAPFVSLWVGNVDSVFSLKTTILFSAYLYLYGMRQSVFMARSSAGQYRQDRWFAIAEAVLNVLFSFVLIKKLGINGVFISSIASFLLVPFWTQPRIVYYYVLDEKLVLYYRRYFLYALITVFSGAITYFVCSFIPSENMIINLFLRLVVCLFIPNVINILIFMKTKDFIYLKNLAFEFLHKVKERRK